MNPITLLSENIVQALGWTLLHAVWQGIAIAAVLAAARAVLKDARYRYAASCAALLTMVTLSAVTMYTQYTPHSDLPESISYRGAATDRSAATELPALKLESLNIPTAVPDTAHTWSDVAEVLQANMPVIVGVWIVGVLLLTVRLLGGCYVSHRLKHTGTNPIPGEWQTRIDTLTQRLNLRHKVQVVTSSIATVPMVVGVLRPVVLVPIATLIGLTQQQLEAILLHELAHIRRYDNFVNLIQRLVETVFFFHPVVWWMSACIRTDREYCCDDIVLADSDRKLYASALVTLERLRSPMLAVAASDGPLLVRVQRMLLPDRESQRDGLSSITASSLLGIVLVLSLAFVLVDGNEVTASDSTPKPGVAYLAHIKAEKPGGSIVGVVRPALRAAGVHMTQSYLRGYFGSAFAINMKKDGGKLPGEKHAGDNQADWHEWSYFWKPIYPFKADQISAQMKGNNAATPEQHHAKKKEAWDKVRRAIDAGRPAIVWQAMTMETKQSGNPAPWLWSLIVGYDEDDETYTVHHAGKVGEFKIKWDAFGHSDGANWLCVMILGPPGESYDVVGKNRRSLLHAVEASEGKHRGTKADAHGLAAWEMWRDAFSSGTVSIEDIDGHADWLRRARADASAYLSELAEDFPEAVRPTLGESAGHYAQVSAAMQSLRNLQSNGTYDLKIGAQLVATALEHERAAVDGLRRVIEMTEN